MKRITILIIAIFILIIAITATVIYRKSDFVADMAMVPKVIVQYSEIAVKSEITKIKANQRPDIIKVSKEREVWSVALNKLAIKEIQYGAVVRLHIGYCSWDSGAVVNGMVAFCPEWHPPFNRNPVIVGLAKDNKYFCSARVW